MARSDVLRFEDSEGSSITSVQRGEYVEADHELVSRWLNEAVYPFLTTHEQPFESYTNWLTRQVPVPSIYAETLDYARNATEARKMRGVFYKFLESNANQPEK